MEGFYALRRDLREKFYPLIRNSASEEKFIEYIKVSLEKSNRFDIRALEVVLDLALVVINQDGHINYDYTTKNMIENDNTKHERSEEHEDDNEVEDFINHLSSNTSHLYDADDEGTDEAFMFPCHLNFDDCHPELLHNYHREHLKTARASIQIIKYPKIASFVIEYMLTSLRMQLEIIKTNSSQNNLNHYDDQYLGRDSTQEINNYQLNCDTVNSYLNSVAIIINRLNKICSVEKRNCRILARTNTLNIILNNINFLIDDYPEKQHVYLEPMLRFAFTLADYKISGTNLKLLFSIIKKDTADLKTVLSLFEQLLNHHYRICKNIQPMKSINFPTASKTAEEIELNLYISNSWHWRLRSKVIEYKRKRSRSIDNQNVLLHQKNLIKNLNSSKTTTEKSFQNKTSNSTTQNTTTTTTNTTLGATTNTSTTYDKITSSWLECSMIAPLSNISPLIHNNGIQFCCSMWVSVCGDLLVIDQTKSSSSSKSKSNGQRVNCDIIDWKNYNGFWLKLTSKKRLVKKYRTERKFNDCNRAKSTKRRLSEKVRKRIANDKQDEEEEETAERIRRSQLELEQQASSFGGLRRNYSSSSNHILAGNLRYSLRTKKTTTTNTNNNNTTYEPNKLIKDKHLKQAKEFLGRRTSENSQESLIHLISFAMDTLTIEIWLNVKSMSFCARACRVARDGLTNLIDQVTFPSHLGANGSWSHLLISLNESNKGHNLHDKMMNLKLLVDGVHKEKEKLTYGAHKSPLTNFALLLGCERSTFGYVWKLSQVNIYKNIPTKDIKFFLLGKGPDFWNFTNFRQQSTLPLQDITQRSIKNLFNPKVLYYYGTTNEELALNWLTQNIVLAYVAHQPTHFLDYSTTIIASSLMNPLPANHEFSNSAERFIQARILNFTRSLKFNTNYSFGSALVEAGGIESVLVCFADVIRRAHETIDTHYLSFSILLKMSQTNQHHLNKFIDDLNGLKLVEYILIHPACIVSKQMLAHYLDFCLMKKSDFLLIKSSKLIYNLLSCWRAWHKDVKVARELYRILIRLLKQGDTFRRSDTILPHIPQSFYVRYNLTMLNDAGGIHLLMAILRECLVPLDETTPKINHELVKLIVDLISLLIKHPPGLDVMLDIMEFLLFLHPDPKSYVEGVPDGTSFLHPLGSDLQECAIYDDTDARTPSTNSYRSSLNDINHQHYYDVRREEKNKNKRHDLFSSRGTVRSSLIAEEEEEGEEVEEREGSDDFYESVDNIHNLTKFIDQYNIQSNQRIPTIKLNQEAWINTSQQQQEQFHNNNQQIYSNYSNQDQRVIDSLDIQKCSNRNFAIANIADILASIVKLPSDVPTKILTEALEKPIIDPKKLIILANNNSALVREKVLRLFLYCIKACYKLNLKSVLSKYEQDTKGFNFKTCIPIQLMAKQLLKYPTTIAMIQLSYGIIVGTNEFETVESVCLRFDIETINNSLQLNTLILLIQLMTKLQHPKDIISAIKFVYSYLNQLLKLQVDKDILSVLIRGNLVECLMKLYFSHIKYEIDMTRTTCDITALDQLDLNKEHNQVLKELDRCLILVVSYFIQFQQTSVSITSIKDLLTYIDLMNTYVPTRHQRILRDRQVKVLYTSMAYCRHYEESARSKKYEGKLDYHMKNFLKRVNLTISSNILSDSQLELDLISKENEFVEEGEEEEEEEEQTGRAYVNGQNKPLNGFSNSNNDDYNFRISDDYDSNMNGNLTNKTKNISEDCVKETFKATLDLTVNFIRIREPDVITSPLEKQFIIKFITSLSNHLREFLSWRDSNQDIKSHWIVLLRDLSDYMKNSFFDLVLYLLSPCKSMNLDERKYYASELLKAFNNDQQLYDLLEDEDKCKILVVFIKDLINQSDESTYADDGDLTDEDVLEDDTENKLKDLAKSIEALIPEYRANGSDNQYKRILRRNKSDSKIKLSRDLIASKWLLELAQKRERAKQGIETLKENDISVVRVSMENLADVSNKILDEALSITRDVVNDKHEQRKAYLEDLKQNKVYNYHIRQQWLSLIIGHTHERAIWFMENHYPKSWELNPVEGPSRIRRRLRPCKLMLEPRYFRRPNKYQLAGRKNVRIGQKHLNNDENNFSNESFLYRDGGVETSVQEIMIDDWYNQYSPHPLCSMVINQEQSMDSNELRIRMFTTDKIHFNCDCSIIRPNEVCDGEVSIASWCIHFIGDRSDNYQKHLNEHYNGNLNYQKQQQFDNNNTNGKIIGQSLNDAVDQNELINDNNSLQSKYNSLPFNANNSEQVDDNRYLTDKNSSSLHRRDAYISTVVEDLWFDEIVEIWDRRYQLQDVGLEIFLTNNMTYLISFKNNNDREDFKQSLMREQHKMVNLQRFNLTTSLNRVTQLWRDGRLTNFDYLTCLNKLAGRSFNDLMQYPIFPFILSNYTSPILDLNQVSNFRKLKKPMAIQNPEKEAIFLNNYQVSQATNLSHGVVGMTKPYHYGNHYSNSATVLHFLVRLPPFTQMLIQYQDNNFDQPDRTFHSISNTWQLITRDSNTDFKELIPEFFFLPEMFQNFEQFDLGRKQNNVLVDDVKLPAWCPNSDARLFTLIHRQALESSYVSENLHHWIDLIFGYKQTGKAAVEAINVFHPATYYGMIDLNNQHDSHSSSTLSSSTTPIKSAIAATLSARSSTYSSDYMSANDIYQSSSLLAPPSTSDNNDNGSSSLKKMMLHQHIIRQQADIERLALETMIKTYGQMPRQLFSQPIRQRLSSTFTTPQVITNNIAASNFNNRSTFINRSLSRQDFGSDDRISISRKIEPLRQVRGLKWGSYVGSPDENDITAVKHKKIIPDEINQGARNSKKTNNHRNQHHIQLVDYYNSREQTKFNLCLLPNGEIAILKSNTSLMLDYRSDRKSGGTNQFSLQQSARYSRRAGLSSVARINLFSNMIISRQKFSYIDTAHAQLETGNSLASSSLVSLTSSRVKFSHDSLSLVSWSYLDGAIRIRHPASNIHKSSVPLVQADSTVDTMTTCASVPELNLLLVGYKSGAICAHIVSTAHQTIPYSQYPTPPSSTTSSSTTTTTSNYHNNSKGNNNLLSSNSSLVGLSAGSNFASATAAAAADVSLAAAGVAPSAVHMSLHISCNNHSTGKDLSSTNNGGGGSTSSNDELNRHRQIHLNRQTLSSSPIQPVQVTSSLSSAQALLGSGKIAANFLTGESYNLLSSQVEKTLQSVKTINKTTRWLYCHSKKVNCMRINVSFGIVVTGSDDGTTVIWDLNSLTYVRTIHYKLESSPMSRTTNGTSYSVDGDGGGEATPPSPPPPPQSQQTATTTTTTTKPATPDGGASRARNCWPTQTVDYQQQLLDYLCDCDHSTQTINEKSLSPSLSSSACLVNPMKGEYYSNKRSTTTTKLYNFRDTATKHCCICSSGVNLVAISDTLGDIVTVKDINNRLAITTESEPNTDINDEDDNADADADYYINADNNHLDRDHHHNNIRDDINDGVGVESSNMSTTSTDQSIELSESSLTSVVYVHTINGALVGFVNCHTQVTAVCYSNAAEGISVNVIVVGLADGLIRLYSSWDLTRVKEFHVSGINLSITSLLYSRDSQLLYITYEDGQLVVLRNKKKSSVSLLKEWYL